MKRLLTLLALFTVYVVNVLAQSTSITMTLKVEDAATKRQIGSATAFVFQKGQSDVDSLMVIKLMKVVPEYIYYGELCRNVADHDTLFVCTRCDDYEEEITPFVIDKNKKKKIELEGTIHFRRMPKRLSEAVVTASKIMMVNKGDTIVYNADYFQLAEGSMLDELISRLPGVKLESGGRITINGNFVSSLLINGKDFFKGDASVALQNLPAYMVNKVKAYQKTPDNAYITRNKTKAEAADPWVIDVNLKRQYSRGWIANAEAGYGTHNRWLGRLFGLRFTDLSRLSLFGNFNNLNDNSSPGSEGRWESFEPIVGQSKMQKAGIFYGVESENRKTSFSSNLVVSYNEDHVRTENSTETFLPMANSYVRSRNQNDSKQTNIDWQSSLTRSGKKVFYSWDNVFYYGRSKNHSHMFSVESAVQPAERYRGALIDSMFVLRNYVRANELTNYYQEQSLQNAKNWSYISLFNADIRLPHNHYVSLQVNGRYYHTDDKGFLHYGLFMPKAYNAEQWQNKYQTVPHHEYQWWTSAFAPILNKKNFRIKANYAYRQEYYSDSRQLYRLDSLGGDWSVEDGCALGMLPSTSDSLTRAIDYANTFQNGRHVYRHTPEMQFYWDFLENGRLSVFLPVNFEHDVVNDLRMVNYRSNISKHYVSFEPHVKFSYGGLIVEARKQLSIPDMNFLLNVRDDSNPLVIKQGNPQLKATDIYSFSAKYNKTITKYAQNYYVGARYQRVHNAIGQSRIYDSATGVTTFTPCNMNGNWTLDASGGYARSLDVKQQWSISTDAAWDYNNNIDFVQSDQNTDVSARSIVRNNSLDANLSLRYQQRSVALSFTTSSKWQHAASSREGFVTISSLDMLYGLTANVKLPWGMAINTDCTVHTRRGYSDETMNTNEWLWNAEMTKSLMKKKNLILKIRAYDLLHQRRNIVRTLNAQGRTETWYNTTPNYILFTLTYRLNVQPKKGKQW